MSQENKQTLHDLLQSRFGDAPAPGAALETNAMLRNMAARGSCRSFTDQPVAPDVLQTLCAIAMAAPTKSDLQQRDIVLLQDQHRRARLAELVSGQAWVADAPMIAIFCGNNRRQRLIHDWHGIPFANDHLDAPFNATADAAIALGAFVTAAEAVGLGCCPISAVRNEAAAVSDLLSLPSHVFPFAGLAIGYRERPAEVAMRLPLSVTCHVDQYGEEGLQDAVQAYDAARTERQPYGTQRFTQTFGTSDTYGWSEDKARQYSQPERADFGAYLRAQGFKLD